MKTPHRGAIAICGNGSLGLITSNTKIPIPLEGNPNYQGWSGIQISPSEIGKQHNKRTVGDTWCSSKPLVLFTADELRTFSDQAYSMVKVAQAAKTANDIRLKVASKPVAKLFVNGHPRQTNKSRLTYTDIKKLAGYGGRFNNTVYTITYKTRNQGGVVRPRESVNVTPDMVINCYYTGNA